MSYLLWDWIHLAVRWLHVVAGVFWIGQTALFSWLDRRLRIEEDADGRQRIWMVHSGGFYAVEKLAATDRPTRHLHWFQWESAFTWLSGMVLLGLVYYAGGALLEPDAPVGTAAGIGLSLGILVVGWVLYDRLWLSPLARRPRLAHALGIAGLVAVAWGCTRVFSGRAAYIQVGALIGTIMTVNVWERILPAQRQMVAAARRGASPDPTLAERAKQRSHHNTFLAFPLIFIMISNHFPVTAYGHRWNWALLGLYLLIGFAARGLVSRHESRPVPAEPGQPDSRA